MDNISEILSSLDESDMQKIKAMASDLFGSESAAAPAAGAGGMDLSGLDLSALSSLMLPRDDARTDLIKALKPLLSEARQKRADEALRLLHLVALLPALQQSGILDKFTSLI